VLTVRAPKEGARSASNQAGEGEWTMFRVSFFCTEKDMGEVLKRLNGIAKDLNHSYVANVESRPNGKLKEIAGSRIELIQKELHKQKLTEVTGSQAKKLMEKVGLNPTSYSHFLQEMVKHGMLRKGKRDGNGMTYIVSEK
jgi:predicted transcriptional regulator